MHSQVRPALAALSTLIVLQAVMLGALFAGVAPHPPASTPLFGIGPFIGMAISAAFAAIILGPGTNAGRILSIVAAIAGLISFGPQKYLDPQIGLIWPAVVSGQIAAITVFWSAYRFFGHARFQGTTSEA